LSGQFIKHAAGSPGGTVRWRTCVESSVPRRRSRSAASRAARSPNPHEIIRCVRHRTYIQHPVADTGFAELSACRPFTGTRSEEHVMSINKDQVKGRLTEAEGRIKEVAGNFTGNETLQLKGKMQKIQGEAQAAFGDLRKDLEDAVKKA
jgi:uncharacterized protein YjbJ (UPF0337 family)